MEVSSTLLMFAAGGVLLAIIGALVFVVALIVLIVRAIMKKKLKVPLILLAVGILLIAGGLFLYVRNYNKISDQYEESLDALRAESAETDEEGNIIYSIGAFSLTDDNGNTIDNGTLAAYQYTVINLWEPWCGPCKAELPDLEQLYEDYRDKGVNLIGVYSTEEDAAEVIAEYGLTYPTVFPGDEAYSSVFGLFQTGAVPTTFVLDSEGKLVMLNLTEEEITSFAGSDLTPEMHTFYNGVVAGSNTYEFWSAQLDALPGVGA